MIQQVNKAIVLARKHICADPANESSARFCLNDALRAVEREGNGIGAGSAAGLDGGGDVVGRRVDHRNRVGILVRNVDRVAIRSHR